MSIMSDQSDHGRGAEPARRRRRTRTACHTCQGQGNIWVPRAAIIDGMAGTKGVWERCRAHGCTNGWLEGVQPPI